MTFSAKHRSRLCSGVFASVLGAVATGLAAPADNAADAREPSPPTAGLVRGLADADPAARRLAADTLTRLDNRPDDAEAPHDARRLAVLRATRDADPQVAAAAEVVLMRLPFARPADPREAREALSDYGQQGEDARARVVVKFLALMDAAAGTPDEAALADVVVRLLHEDPSVAVGWRVVNRLRRETLPDVVRDAVAVEPLLPLRSHEAFLAGFALLGRDDEAALRHFARAAELEKRDPSRDFGEMKIAYDHLFAHAYRRGDRAAALAVRRDQAARQARLGLTPEVGELLSAHVRLGPDAYLADDMAAHANRLGDPPALYALSALASEAGNRLLADALAQAAFGSSLSVSRLHANAGNFATLQGYDHAARRELTYTLDRLGNPQTPDSVACNSHLRLSAVAYRSGDLRASAHHLKQVVKTRSGVIIQTNIRGGTRAWTDEEILASAEFRLLQAAQADGDEAAVAQHLDKIAEMGVGGDEIVEEVVPLLLEAGRDAEAKKLFAGAYAEAKKRLDENPNDPSALNNLAWLCARTGMRVAEGLELARRAVELEPDNASFLDTLAEAEFRSGNVRRAIELETRAVELRPDDDFLQEQLQRFRDGLPE